MSFFTTRHRGMGEGFGLCERHVSQIQQGEEAEVTEDKVLFHPTEQEQDHLMVMKYLPTPVIKQLNEFKSDLCYANECSQSHIWRFCFKLIQSIGTSGNSGVLWCFPRPD